MCQKSRYAELLHPKPQTKHKAGFMLSTAAPHTQSVVIFCSVYPIYCQFPLNTHASLVIVVSVSAADLHTHCW